MTYEVPANLKMDRLEKGRVYTFMARNFFYGVYDGEGGFIGIRRKFGERYLFTEYHYDKDPHVGTVRPIAATEHLVPEGVELKEIGDPLCRLCAEEVVFAKDKGGPRGTWIHVDRPDLDDLHSVRAYRQINQPLFNFLDDLQELEKHE